MVVRCRVAGAIRFSLWPVVLLGVVFWATYAALLWFGVRAFRDTEIIARP